MPKVEYSYYTSNPRNTETGATAVDERFDVAPCPECGSKFVDFYYADDNCSWPAVMVGCNICSYRGLESLDHEGAVSLWNE